MKIAVYLSGVPAKAKNEFKRSILTRFAYGAKHAGDEVFLVDQLTPIDCDLAVIQGWINSKISPHLKLRSDVIDHQRNNKKYLLAIDSNLYGFLQPEDFNKYLRYSIGDVFPNRGYYFDNNVDSSRWQKVKQCYGFQERDWNTQGNNILITLQRNGGWSMGNVTIQSWLDKIIPEIRQHTDRPIVIRPHPGNTTIVPTLNWPSKLNVRLSTEPDIKKELDQTWATVTFNSSPGVASLIWGVPVWVTDPNPTRSQCWPWASKDLSQLENPPRPARQTFYDKIAQCHFNAEELDSGEAWQFMRQRLPNT